MADLSSVTSRDKLPRRREPHWQKLAKGQYLGYRTPSTGKSGNWLARWFDAEEGKQRYHRLGDFGHLPPSDRYDAASAASRAWFSHVTSGGTHEEVTVRQACERYASLSPDAAKRFPRYVYSDPIAKVPLRKLTDRHVREWRGRLAATPAMVTRSKTAPVVTRTRAASTLNRDMTPFRAALNLAFAQGDVLTDRAWKQALAPAEAQGRRKVYLDKDQRRKLLEALPEDAARFARGLCLLPFRPQALADLTVGDFDPRKSELHVRGDKAGAGRVLLLPAETAGFLKECSRLKTPGAPIFTMANGGAWSKDFWKKPFKAAVRAAGLPEDATAYSLRHSTITDLVQRLDLLAVAQLSGTSVRMIERHYGHLQQHRAAAALADLAL